jgi:hypothetical protein
MARRLEGNMGRHAGRGSVITPGIGSVGLLSAASVCVVHWSASHMTDNLEKLIMAELVTKFIVLYGKRWFPTLLTNARHQSLSILSQINSIRTSYLFKIIFNIILPSVHTASKLPLPFSFSYQNIVRISFVPLGTCLCRQTNPTGFHRNNNSRWRIQSVRLLFKHFSPDSGSSPLGPSCQHPALKHHYTRESQ